MGRKWFVRRGVKVASKRYGVDPETPRREPQPERCMRVVWWARDVMSIELDYGVSWALSSVPSAEALESLYRAFQSHLRDIGRVGYYRPDAEAAQFAKWYQELGQKVS